MIPPMFHAVRTLMTIKTDKFSLFELILNFRKLILQIVSKINHFPNEKQTDYKFLIKQMLRYVTI